MWSNGGQRGSGENDEVEVYQKDNPKKRSVSKMYWLYGL